MEMRNVKIVLIGLFPPPYGGRSIHIERLKERFDELGMANIIYDTSGVSKKVDNVINVNKMSLLLYLLRQIFCDEVCIFHYHDHGLKLLGIISILSFLKGKKAICTLHSFRYSSKHFDIWQNVIWWLAQKARVYFIAVNHEILKILIAHGINCKDIAIIPAFLPPIIKEEEVDEIPSNIWGFMNQHTPIISANASSIVFYNNEDLYGIDMCIDLCANLKNTYPEIGFIFCLPDIGDYNYFQTMKQRIVEKGIENNFLFQTKPCQLYPIIIKSNVFVRPTNTDGDAISLREALHFKVPIGASDIVPRPKGAVLFRNRDIDDFTLKVKDILDNYEFHKNRIENIESDDFGREILNIYLKAKESI